MSDAERIEALEAKCALLAASLRKQDARVAELEAALRGPAGLDCVSVPDDGGDDWIGRDDEDQHIDDTGCVRCEARRALAGKVA